MKKKLLSLILTGVMLLSAPSGAMALEFSSGEPAADEFTEHKAKEYAENPSGGTASEQQDADEADDDGDEYAETEPLATLFFASDYQEEEGFEKPSVTLSNILETANINLFQVLKNCM